MKHSKKRETVVTAALFAMLVTHAGCGDDKDNGEGGGDVNTDTDSDTDSDSDSDSAHQGDSRWLHTDGNKIYYGDNTVFRGRGTNIHDTRSCNACTWYDPNVDEVKRRIDELVDGWGANFMRLLLESYAESLPYQIHWAGLLDDEDYLDDIIEIVDHIGTKSKVYVLVSLWIEPTTTDMGWPTAETNAVWQALAAALVDRPYVLFGLINEPQSNYGGENDGDVWSAMNSAVQAIRDIEAAHNSPKHIIAVQGTRAWARNLGYYVDHPITAGDGENIAYETHAYIHEEEFEEIWVGPSATLPVIVGEFGPSEYSNDSDCVAVMDEAEARDIPWLAWTFHMRCDPSLLVDNTGDGDGCGFGMDLVPSQWGTVIKDRLASPWQAK
jgi:hypothetical protein